MNAIISPLLSEKSAARIDSGLYVFYVNKTANKDTIAKELKAVYDVDAVSVRVVNLPAKKVNFKRHKGIRSARRKAYVQLAPKQQIAGFEILKKADDTDKKVEEKGSK